MGIFVSQLGNFFTDIFSAIGGFFETIGAIFGAILDQIFAPIWQILYYLFVGIAQIANFCEVVFKKVAGLDTVYMNGVPYGGAQQVGSGAGNTGGIVMAFLTNNTVYKMLIAIIVFSVVLLFLTTIIAIIKAEFAIDVKGSAKGPIIGRALKSLVMFFIVPIVTVLGVYLTNIITLAANQLLSGTQRMGIVNNCFKVAAYGANRGRNNAEIASYWANGLGGGGWTPDRVDAAFVKTGTGGAEKMPVINLKKDGSWQLNAGVIGGIDTIVGAVGGAAAAVTPWAMAAPGVMGLFKLGMIAVANIQGEAVEGALIGNMHAMLVPMPSAGSNLSFYNYYQVNYFYSMSDFDYILGIGTALVMSWLLLSTCITLLKRVFEITMLMLLAPPMIALAPLDNGQAQKKWTGEMIKRVISVIGPVFAFNMYFLLVPLFDGLSLFGSLMSVSGTLSVGATQMGMPFLAGAAVAVIAYDIFFQLITVIVGLSIVKQASALISALLGVEDLIKSGLDASKKAVATGASIATMAIGGAGLAVKGASALLKAGKAAKMAKVAKGRKGQTSKFTESEDKAKKSMDSLKESRDQSQQELEDAQEAYENIDPSFYGGDQEAYAAARKEAKERVNKAQKKLDSSQERLDRSEEIYAAKKSDADMWRSGASEKDIEKKKDERSAARSRDKAIKEAKDKFAKSAGTEEDQNAMDDAIAAANRQYQKDTGHGAAAFVGGIKDSIGSGFARSALGKGIAQEFGKTASGASVFAGSKHMDKSSQLMFRMVLDNWVGMMGGKEDGAGLVVRRLFEKTERERFFYSGKENKQLELKREQGLLMAERAKSEENMRQDKEKAKEKDLLRTMLQDQGLSGKELEEAFFNAWTRIQQGKGVAGFDEYKKRDEQKAKEDSRKKAISDKIEAHGVDVKAQEQITKAAREKAEDNDKSKPVKLDSNSINSMKSILGGGLKEAIATGNTKLVSEIKTALSNLNNPTVEKMEQVRKVLEQLAKK